MNVANEMPKSDCLFASMRSMTHNVGEEVQWLAAERFLPRIDILANKNRLSDLCPSQHTKLIMNGWYTMRPRRVIPGTNVEPLLISMHIRPECYKDFSKGKLRDFLLRNGPVGCRDESTHRFLENESIPSYYSGCLTLTLQRNPKVEQNGYVICVGLTDEEVSVVEKRTTHKVVSINRLVPMIYSQETRMDIARAFMALYQGAHCVVTKMLHVALPCLALGTPCLVIDLDAKNPVCQAGRFDGVSEMLYHISPDSLLKEDFDYDFDSPPAPSGEMRRKFESLRDGLVEKCTAFTGFDRNESLLTITDPMYYFLRVLSRLEYYRTDNWHALYYMPLRKLLKAVWNRGIRRMTAHDL